MNVGEGLDNQSLAGQAALYDLVFTSQIPTGERSILLVSSQGNGVAGALLDLGGINAEGTVAGTPLFCGPEAEAAGLHSHPSR